MKEQEAAKKEYKEAVNEGKQASLAYRNTLNR